MEPVNIHKYILRDARGSNYRLRGEKIQTFCTTTPVFNFPGVDSWEDDGGMVAPPPVTKEINWGDQFKMRRRGSRKQIAARKVRKVETAAVVVVKKPQPVEVVDVLYKNMDDNGRVSETGLEQVKVAELRAKISQMLEILGRKERAAKQAADAKNRLAIAKAKLEAIFQEKRLK